MFFFFIVTFNWSGINNILQKIPSRTGWSSQSALKLNHQVSSKQQKPSQIGKQNPMHNFWKATDCNLRERENPHWESSKKETPLNNSCRERAVCWRCSPWMRIQCRGIRLFCCRFHTKTKNSEFGFQAQRCFSPKFGYLLANAAELDDCK
jgi:hypothetical protein